MGLTGRDIRRGDVYLVDFGPRRGNEKAMPHPAVVLSINAVNSFEFIIVVVPGTKGEKVRRERQGDVRVPPGEAGLPMETVFEARQVAAIDPKKVIRRYGTMSAAALNRVEAAVRLTLGL